MGSRSFVARLEHEKNRVMYFVLGNILEMSYVLKHFFKFFIWTKVLSECCTNFPKSWIYHLTLTFKYVIWNKSLLCTRLVFKVIPKISTSHAPPNKLPWTRKILGSQKIKKGLIWYMRIWGLGVLKRGTTCTCFCVSKWIRLKHIVTRTLPICGKVWWYSLC